MKLSDLLNVDLLAQHLENGLVSKRSHPFLPIYILNYTHAAQYDPHWGDGTIDWCRGLIVDKDDNIISLPFKKFHNLNTASIPETMEANLPNEQPVVTEKVDGSLGIYWEYDGHRGIATRGSFTSDQAVWATNWFIKHADWFYKTMTPLFEIVYPENRIVVDYGDYSGLILLGVMDKVTTQEIPRNQTLWLSGVSSFLKLPKDYTGYSLKALSEWKENNFEGFVLTYSNGLKVKVKLEEYVRLHKILTGMNPKGIWEALKNDTPLPKDGTPEFQIWMNEWVDRIMGNFREVADQARKIYLDRPPYTTSGESRKDFAMYVQREAPRHLHGILYSMHDGKDPSAIIWKMIEPKGGNEFKSDYEGVTNEI